MPSASLIVAGVQYIMMEKWMLLVACLLIQFCRLTFAQTNSSALAPKGWYSSLYHSAVEFVGVMNPEMSAFCDDFSQKGCKIILNLYEKNITIQTFDKRTGPLMDQLLEE